MEQDVGIPCLIEGSEGQHEKDAVQKQLQSQRSRKPVTEGDQIGQGGMRDTYGHLWISVWSSLTSTNDGA